MTWTPGWMAALEAGAQAEAAAGASRATAAASSAAVANLIRFIGSLPILVVPEGLPPPAAEESTQNSVVKTGRDGITHGGSHRRWSRQDRTAARKAPG